MKARLLVLAICAALALMSAPVSAQEATGAANPANAVQEFYLWYLGQARRGNPVVDGAYRESAYLSAHLIDAVDSLVAEADPDYGIGYDPFLCAQDVPERFSFEVLKRAEGQAVVALSAFFGGNPRAHNSTLRVVEEGSAWVIDEIDCVDNVTPQGVAESFYQWYLAYSQPDETGAIKNPLVDRAYRDYPYLSDALIAEVDALLNRMAGQPGGYDPFLCAQDVPERVTADLIDEPGKAATVIVHEYFSGNLAPKRVLVELTGAPAAWEIDGIVCEVGPEVIAVNLLNWYMAYVSYDMEHGISRTPFTDWAFGWGDSLSDDLLAALEATFASAEPRVADPVLCAQDIPVRVTAEALMASEGAATVQISGEYPSGPDTFMAYALASLEMALDGNQWKVTAITCAQ